MTDKRRTASIEKTKLLMFSGVIIVLVRCVSQSKVKNMNLNYEHAHGHLTTERNLDSGERILAVLAGYSMVLRKDYTREMIVRKREEKSDRLNTIWRRESVSI